MREIIIYGGKKHDYKKQYLTEGLYAGDAGYTLVVKCGQDVSECAVEAIITRADGAVYSFLGFAAEKEARCLLPSYAVGIPGKWEARVRVISGASVVTEAFVEGYVYEAAEVTDAAHDDRLPILTDLLSQMKALELEIEEAEKDRQEAEAQRRENWPYLPEGVKLRYGYFGPTMPHAVIQSSPDTAQAWLESVMNNSHEGNSVMEPAEITQFTINILGASYKGYFMILTTREIRIIRDGSMRDDTASWYKDEVGEFYVYSYHYPTETGMTFTVYY